MSSRHEKSSLCVSKFVYMCTFLHEEPFFVEWGLGGGGGRCIFLLEESYEFLIKCLRGTFYGGKFWRKTKICGYLWEFPDACGSVWDFVGFKVADERWNQF